MKSMANIKTLLRLLGAGVLTTVAATSVVACDNGGTDNTQGLPTQVAIDLGLMTKDAALVSAKIKIDTNKLSFDTSLDLTTLTAANLLNQDGTAKSEDSNKFLTNVLKLKADKDDKFQANDALKVIIEASDITVTPNIAKHTGNTDFDATGGDFKFKFTLADKSKTEAYKVNLLKKENIVSAANLTQLVVGDFTPDATTYKAGQTLSGQKKVPFNGDSDGVKQIKSLADLLKQQGNLTQTITKVQKPTGSEETDPNYQLASGDKGIVSVNIGDVTIQTVTLNPVA